MRHFSFPACRRIARYFGLTYIPKYHADDILTQVFVEMLARKIYSACDDLTTKTERLAMLLFWDYYNNGTLSLEVFVCSMIPQEPAPVVEPVVKVEEEKKAIDNVG